ncbi:hypothetical protein JOD64_000463 [Micromonospora luteifusca]|uniref:DUF4231 domain-containing protein n=1 Tax=Micromonospora luteifusca TaxID=709860 RepID=A0ABS2LM30_9ACTN|nr:SLATT domain-containing protein [Micromonospora luteifusca]MBM7489241.1 hypothetical protein [Micromonospora luteifusca]
MSIYRRRSGVLAGSQKAAFEDPLQGYRTLAEASVNKLRDQYDWRAKWHRRLFRFSGILVIVISASLPLLAGFSYPGKNLIIAASGVIIATATALRTFYQWDQMWALLRRTHFGLIEANNQWKLAFGRAETTADPAQREQLAFEATEALLAKIEAIRSAETEKFFSSLAFPDETTLARRPFQP